MRILLVAFIVLISYAFYWFFEPFSINQASDSSTLISLSNINTKCNTSKELNHKGDSIIDAVIASKEILGVSTGIHIKDCEPWFSSSGVLNKTHKNKPNNQSLFRIASISKSMTAVAILQLYEKGKIDLDVPIQTYLPEFPTKKKGTITIRQILKHRSGIPHYKSKMGIFHFKNYENCTEALNRFKNRALIFKPDTSFLYSSYGYTVLGAIIENVSGKSYKDYMIESVWNPAHMTNTNIEQKHIEYQNKAGLYIKTGIGFIRSPKNNLSYTYPGGGVISTTEDMLKFGQAILEYKLINPTSTQLMISLSDETSKEKEYTLGWDTWISSKHGKVIEHNGAQIGASSFFRVYFDKKVIAVSLANSLNSSESVRNLTIKLANLAMEE